MSFISPTGTWILDMTLAVKPIALSTSAAGLTLPTRILILMPAMLLFQPPDLDTSTATLHRILHFLLSQRWINLSTDPASSSLFSLVILLVMTMMINSVENMWSMRRPSLIRHLRHRWAVSQSMQLLETTTACQKHTIVPTASITALAILMLSLVTYPI